MSTNIDIVLATLTTGEERCRAEQASGSKTWTLYDPRRISLGKEADSMIASTTVVTFLTDCRLLRGFTLFSG